MLAGANTSLTTSTVWFPDQPLLYGRTQEGNQISCISDRETDTVHLHGARGNSYCLKQIAGLGLRLITSAVFIIKDGDSNTVIAEQLIITVDPSGLNGLSMKVWRSCKGSKSLVHACYLSL